LFQNDRANVPIAEEVRGFAWRLSLNPSGVAREKQLAMKKRETLSGTMGRMRIIEPKP
jgi:hypothetical protein